VSTTIDATFDGSVFRPSKPVELPPNTPVRLTVEAVQTKPDTPASFLRTTRALKLKGPPDWATNLDHYLYGGGDLGDK
jgi:hypothetical protein